MKQKTAIDFFVEEIGYQDSDGTWRIGLKGDTAIQDVYDKAKRLEKEQIMLSHCDGFLRTTDLQILNPEQYYNETYKQD